MWRWEFRWMQDYSWYQGVINTGQQERLVSTGKGFPSDRWSLAEMRRVTAWLKLNLQRWCGCREHEEKDDFTTELRRSWRFIGRGLTGDSWTFSPVLACPVPPLATRSRCLGLLSKSSGGHVTHYVTQVVKQVSLASRLLPLPEESRGRSSLVCWLLVQWYYVFDICLLLSLAPLDRWYCDTRLVLYFLSDDLFFLCLTSVFFTLGSSNAGTTNFGNVIERRGA